MRINNKLLLSILFLVVSSGLFFSYNNAKKPGLNSWNSLSRDSSLLSLTAKIGGKGTLHVQMVPLLNALANAKINEPVEVLFRVGRSRNLVSLGKYLPKGYVKPKGKGKHIQGVEPTTFPSKPIKQHIQGVEPTSFPDSRTSIWKQVKFSLPSAKIKTKQINIILIFRNASGKVTAKLASKLLL